MYLIRKLVRGDELRDDELLMILIGTADKARSAAWDLAQIAIRYAPKRKERR